MKLEIRNGRVVDPATNFDERTNIYITDDKITSIGAAFETVLLRKSHQYRSLVILIKYSSRLDHACNYRWQRLNQSGKY